MTDDTTPGEVTVTETPKWDPSKTRLGIARDLSAIPDLIFELHFQALDEPNSRDFPGGTALHMTAPVAGSEAWERQYARKETLERFDPKTGKDRWEGPISPFTGLPTSNDNDPAIYQSEADAAIQPLNVLESWTRRIREELDQPTSLKPTISREIDYIRNNLDWATRTTEAGEAEWRPVKAMRQELRDLVRAMEAVLHNGPQRTNIPCIHPDCETNSRLVKAEGTKYRCPSCRTDYSEAQYLQAIAANMSGTAAEKWVLATDATIIINVPTPTMRSWISRGTVATMWDEGRLHVWWPDVRAADMTRKARALTKTGTGVA